MQTVFDNTVDLKVISTQAYIFGELRGQALVKTLRDRRTSGFHNAITPPKIS